MAKRNQTAGTSAVEETQSSVADSSADESADESPRKKQRKTPERIPVFEFLERDGEFYALEDSYRQYILSFRHQPAKINVSYAAPVARTVDELFKFVEAKLFS